MKGGRAVQISDLQAVILILLAYCADKCLVYKDSIQCSAIKPYCIYQPLIEHSKIAKLVDTKGTKIF